MDAEEDQCQVTKDLVCYIKEFVFLSYKQGGLALQDFMSWSEMIRLVFRNLLVAE